MDDEWAQEDAEPIAVAQGAFVDEALQESDDLGAWDDDLDENGDEVVQEPVKPAVELKKKKPLAQAIAERKAADELKQQELVAKKKLELEQQQLEDPLERKRRAEQMSREADMQHAMDLFAVTSVSSAAAVVQDTKPAAYSLDSAQPKTKPELEQFANELTKKVLAQSLKSSLLVPFLEKLFRDLADPLDPLDMRKLSSILNAVANDKQRQARDKGKKKTNVKASVRMVADPFSATDDYRGGADDVDDFM